MLDEQRERERSARMENEERIRWEQIRDLDDMEELQVEEVDESYCSSPENENGGAGAYDILTFDTSPSLCTYLGEVHDAHQSLSFLDGGTILNMHMLYLEGVVLFPEATLPLKAIHPRFRAAVERALNQADAPNIIAVVHAYVHPDDKNLQFASVGTTAEIRKYQRLEDGSLNVLVRGLQRFHLRSHEIDVEGTSCAEVQIIQEEVPLRTPKDAFGQLASVINAWNHNISQSVPSDASHSKNVSCYEDNDLESMSGTSFENELSPAELQMHQSAINSCRRHDSINELTSTSNDQYVCESKHNSSDKSSRSYGASLDTRHPSPLARQSHSHEGWKKILAASESKWSYRAPRAHWPHWVYRMYDSYFLAQRIAVMWVQIFRVPNMDDLAKKPSLLSFYIANKIPVSVSLKQELLEIDGISYRLRREIELLECFDLVRCKICKSVIAKRSEMVEMPKNGPIGAYVNPRGFVNEILTFANTDGLTLTGDPVEEYSWFSGYAWTITTCASCKSRMGWLFTATNKELKPNAFWAIWSFQIVDKIS